MNQANEPEAGQIEIGRIERRDWTLPLGRVNVAIAGFGTVGSSVARILCEHPAPGIALTCIFNRRIERKRVEWVPTSVRWTDNYEDVLTSDAHIVLELAGGLSPAGEWVRSAIAAGKSVVTANKKLIASHGPALEELARRHGAQLLYGAAVAGGIPVLPGLQQGLAGDRIHRLHGILNGTCNFILSRMEAGAEFAGVLREAQQRGYAEANASEDLDGYDARAKLVILSRIGLRMEMLPEEVACRTISDVSAVDFAYAGDLSCTIRQIARAEVRADELLAAVGPMLVAQSSPLARCRDTENMVVCSGQYGGETVFSGHGAGGHPTAVAVVSDVLSIAHGGSPVTLETRRARVDGDLEVPHYIRFLVDDRPGIVAEIAGDLAAERINIHAILQKPGYPKHCMPFVVTVEACRGSALKRALAKIARQPWLQAPPFDLQILDSL